MNAPLKAVGEFRSTSQQRCARSAARRAGLRARWRWLRRHKRTGRSPRMAKAIRGSLPRSSPPMRRTVAEAKSGGATPAFLDRLALDADAGRGHGGRARGDPQAQGSGRHRAGVVAAAQRHAHRARPRAARRRRRDLREPPQCHRGCRRALPQGRQCRDPARRFGKLPLVPRDPRRDGRGLGRSRAAGRGDHAGADPRS